jgi:DNA-3-methyladenine glycosylase II
VHRDAVKYLREVDPKLAQVIDRVGECRYSPRTEGSHFDYILRAIVGQQLSTKAATTIHRRVLDVYGGRSPSAAQLLATSDATLRSAGLSGQKTRYVKDLAARVTSGELHVDTLHELDDAEVIASLVRVTGVGVWTAQMFLMFRLGRMDVLPHLDLGVRKGLQLAHRMRKLPSPEKVLRVGKVWSPYASVAAWYLWRSLDTQV